MIPNDWNVIKESYAVHYELPVLWSDLDAADHINNIIYLKWSETGRIMLFDHLGMDISFQQGAAGPILAWQDCKYISPISYPDTARVATKVTDVGSDRFMMQSVVFSKADNRLAAFTNQSIMAYSYTKRAKVDLPEDWRTRLEASMASCEQS